VLQVLGHESDPPASVVDVGGAGVVEVVVGGEGEDVGVGGVVLTLLTSTSMHEVKSSSVFLQTQSQRSVAGPASMETGRVTF